MNRWLWVLQVLLAIVFLAHGLMMLFPPESIVEQMNASLPRWFQVFLGAMLLGAVFANRYTLERARGAT